MLQNCCCCCKLKSAGVILGTLGVIGYSFLAFSMAIQLLMLPSAKIPENLYKVVFLTFCIIFAISVITLIAAVLLIYGTKKNCHLCLLPWLILSGLQIIGGFFLLILSMFDVYGVIEMAGKMALLIGVFLIVCLTAYFWLVIVSLYKEIKAENNSDK